MSGKRVADRPEPIEKSIAKSILVPGRRSNGRPLSALQEKLRKRLESGQFRELNEELYTCTGAQAAAMMRSGPGLFAKYHAGYAEQVRRWPSNPLERVLSFLKSQRADLRVADLGCGEARLSSESPQSTVHSFDLVAVNDRVTACDIANLPLKESSVDIAVFCLSLMGTNYGEFLTEARRVLRPSGWVLIAEVASRFEDHDARTFKKAVEALGFRSDNSHPFVTDELSSADTCILLPSGKARKRARANRGNVPKHLAQKSRKSSSGQSGSPFFLFFAFQTTKGVSKVRAKKSGADLPTLKPCVYKKR
jgi:ribosomal RNA-processing protein 8